MIRIIILHSAQSIIRQADVRYGPFCSFIQCLGNCLDLGNFRQLPSRKKLQMRRRKIQVSTASVALAVPRDWSRAREGGAPWLAPLRVTNEQALGCCQVWRHECLKPEDVGDNSSPRNNLAADEPRVDSGFCPFKGATRSRSLQAH